MMKVGRETEPVDRVRSLVDARRRIGQIVPNESDPLGNVADDDVGRRDVEAVLDERRGDCGSPADADLDDAIVRRECVDEGRFLCVFHAGTLIVRHAIGVAMRVEIVPVGDIAPEVKRESSEALRSIYGCDISLADDQPLPSGAYDPGRDQYRAEEFIEIAGRVGRGRKNIAVTDRDLYYRRRNYVFGLAYLDGNGSVISTYRLQTSTDGGFSERSASDIFADRVRKEVVHEIGHTMGLEHCDNNRCVMSFSPTVREVDRKEETMCGTCRPRLG